MNAFTALCPSVTSTTCASWSAASTAIAAGSPSWNYYPWTSSRTGSRTGARGLDTDHLDRLLRQTRYDDFDERDPYFRFDWTGDPVSSDGSFSFSDIDDIAEYIDDNADELDRWGVNDDLADSIRAALDDPEDEDEDEDDADDEDEDIELLPRENIAAVLADWYADTERALPTDEELRQNAAACEAQERPLDPADVRDWADFWLTL